MCEVVDEFPEQNGDKWDMLFGERTLIIPFIEEDQIVLEDVFYELKGQLFCEHPDTDRHLMEVPKGKALKCPAGTTLRIVLPEPLKHKGIRR
jgi:hypothetical protein